MIIGIILAAGKGTRIRSKDRNKVTLPFLNKPIICYGAELFQNICDKVVVVIGAFHESVRQALKDYSVIYALQKKRLGTGHAVKVALDEIAKKPFSPTLILVAYGDHTMFYRKETVLNLLKKHKDQRAVISLVTTMYNQPDELVWGRIVRDETGEIIRIVEQKDADPDERKIKEINAGFYCFEYDFLKRNISRIKKSSVTGEYYLTDLVEIALAQKKKVIGLQVPFEGVGIGINRYQELEESQKIYLQSRR